MSNGNLNIEKMGIIGLTKWLENKGHKVEKSDKKVFDLIVDGEYAEVKTKKGGWEKFDFFGLTQNQFAAAKSGELKHIYLVLNANDPEGIDVIKLRTRELIESNYTEERTYFWYKSAIKNISQR